MAKKTLLQMVQIILSSMDSDDVNSIIDTEEALQVVTIIEDTYFDLMNEPTNGWAHLKGQAQLESVGDSTRPNFLKLPDSISEINEFRYDITETGVVDKSIEKIDYRAPMDFLDDTLGRRISETNIQEITTSEGVPLFVFNDRAPIWWTSFDDEFIITDAFNNTVDSTLQGNKSMVLCTKIPVFTSTSDTFIPDLPDEMFPLLIAESRRACHVFLKQQDSVIDAKRSLKGRNKLKHKGWRAHDSEKKIRFGRR